MQSQQLGSFYKANRFSKMGDYQKPKMTVVSNQAVGNRSYIDNHNIKKVVNPQKMCKNGHKNCIYVPCDPMQRPIYGYKGYTSCGRSFKDDFCFHRYCHDNRLNLAAGDAMALRAQIHLNRTGEY